MTIDDVMIGVQIETLVLVAVWQQAFVFQGYFNILEKSTQTRQVLYFRCEYTRPYPTSSIDEEFTPDAWHFTDLYNEANTLELTFIEASNTDALYLLKYALHTTLLLMRQSKKQSFVAMDEIAMQVIIEQLKPLFSESSHEHPNPDIGFAVSMDFNPEEQTGQNTVLTLLGKTKKPAGLH